MDVSQDESILDVSYWYTDAWIIDAFARGLLQSRNRPGIRKHVAESALTRILDGAFDSKVSLSQSLFARAKSPSTLLALMGFRANEVEPQAWTQGYKLALEGGIDFWTEADQPEHNAAAWGMGCAAADYLLSGLDIEDLRVFHNRDTGKAGVCST